MELNAPRWLIFSLLTLVLWGIWGFAYKLSGEHMAYRAVLFYSLIAYIVVDILLILYLGMPTGASSQGITYAIIGGVFGAVASLTFLAAIESGKASVVTPLTAMYPAVTIALAMLVLHEPLTLKQVAGIGFALLATLMFAL